MVELDFCSKGIHIFVKNGQRYINYGNGDVNAGKYYYLEIIQNRHPPLDIVLRNSISNLYRLATETYNVEIFKKATDGELCKINNSKTRTEVAAILLIIYLAMVDLEETHKYQVGFGKRMVHDSCMAVMDGRLDYRAAAVMFQKRHEPKADDCEEDYSYDYSTGCGDITDWDNYGKSGEKYGWYNGFSDDVIDDAFDGRPEATWNVD